jgi:hypothetical protein
MRYTEILEACWTGYRQAGMKKKGDRQVPNCVPVSEQEMEEDLKKWFKEKWVRFGPDGKIRGDCARGSESEGKPKCLPRSKAQALGKKGRASSAAKKRREDPDPERRGPAKNVATKVKEQYTDDDDWYDDEDQDTELRSGDYVRDTMDGEYGEVFRMQGDPYERRVRILDRDGRGWYIEPSRLTRVDPQDPDVQRYFGKHRRRDMDEVADEQINELDVNTLKSYADKRGAQVAAMKADNPNPTAGSKEWIQQAVPAQQVGRAKQKIARKERQQGMAEDSRGSATRQGQQDYAKGLSRQQNPYYKSQQGQTPPEAYDWEAGWEHARDAGKESGVAEGWSDAMVARRTGQPRTPYSVYIKGKKWKDFENDDLARAVMDKLKAKFQADGRDPETITIAPTDMTETSTIMSALKQVDEKQDACYSKVKSRYKVWPSAYASGALVQCRKKGAANWGNKDKK